MTDSGGAARRKRKPYASLDREKIIQAALAIASRPGVASLKVRELGDELGADPTSIYRHFRNKDELTAALVDRLMQLICDRLPEDTGDWRGRVLAGAVAALDVFLEYPCLGVEAVRLRSVGPAELGLIEVVLGALEQAGLEGDELVRHYGALTGYFFSFAAMAASGQIDALRQVAEEPWVQPAEEITALDHPRLFAVWDRISTMQYRETYLTGVNVILDAIAAAGARGKD